MRRRGYEDSLPSYRQERSWSDRTIPLDIPIFTKYVFIGFCVNNKQLVISIPDVTRFAGMADTPVPIDDTEMQSLQPALKAADKRGPWPLLEVGQKVEIRQGLLGGIRAKVVHFNDKQRLILSIALLRQSAFVEIEGHDFTPVSNLENGSISTDTVGLLPHSQFSNASLHECAFG
jgi:transcription antitermination factor NusG